MPACADCALYDNAGLLTYRIARSEFGKKETCMATPARGRDCVKDGPFRYAYPRPALTVDCVVFSVIAGSLRVLLIRRAS